jgi:hypothetical protein
MRREGQYKIGRSQKPATRRKQLTRRKAVPEIVHLIESASGVAQSVESALHLRFAHRRIKGEWFALSNDDVQAIRGIGPCRLLNELPDWLPRLSNVQLVSFRLSEGAIEAIAGLQAAYRCSGADVLEMALRRIARVDLAEGTWPALAVLDAAAALLEKKAPG